jgi:HPt (histidine-containing phosphotransfer) domain-containing protein
VANPSRAGERVETRFERAKLDQLNAVTSPSTFRPLLAGLIEGLEKRLTAVAALMEANDFAAAGHEAHDLVAIAGNLGGMRLSALARQAQLAGLAGDSEKCRMAAAALQREADAVLPLIRDYQSAMAA